MPDSSPPSKRRIRFSILNLLLLTAIVGLSLSLWRENQRMIPLENHILKLRREAGMVNAPDPTKLYVQPLKVRFSKSRNLRWRVYVPPGGFGQAWLNFIPQGEEPTISKSAVGFHSGESTFEFFVSRSNVPGRWSYDLHHATQYGGGTSGLGASSIEPPWLEQGSKKRLKEYVFVPTQGAATGESLKLMQWTGKTSEGDLVDVSITIELIELKAK